MKDASPVQRYTVDNRYGDAVVTLMVAQLAQSVVSFTDAVEDWEEEQPITASPAQCVTQLAVPDGGPAADDFQSGRVFLRGRFKVVGEADAPTGFVVDDHAPATWLRIDRLPLVKDTLKKLYSDLLTDGKTHA